MTAKTWNEVFARLDAFVDAFGADVRAVADLDGADEAELRSLRTQLDDARAALEAYETRVKVLTRERDEATLPTPDATNPADVRRAAMVIEQLALSEGWYCKSFVTRLRTTADRLEAAQAEKASVDELVEKAARVIHDSDEQGEFPPREWGARSEALRNDYRANARALLAAGLLADGGE